MNFSYKELGDGFLVELSYKEQKISNSVVDSVVDEKLKSVLKLIIESNNTSASQIANKLGVSTRTIQRYIKERKDSNLLQRIGDEKTGYWKIINIKNND